MTSTMFRIWLFASLAWIAFVIYGALDRWPHVPLDLGGPDPSLDAAYQAAQLQHVAKALLFGLGGPVLGYIVLRLVARVVGRAGGRMGAK